MCPKFTETEGCRTWQEEFDRRWASGKYRRERSRMFARMGDRVVDDTGKLFTRKGEDCCGCGRSETAADDSDIMGRGPRWRGPGGRQMKAKNPHARSRWF
jgi:hypothetical protein